ncbi:MAG: insulinase family protein [Oscillospiraceae bacterium]|jgi:predicted Zn-dependent peptidase|nr:insulinase family protein [Oscillospiraceae bacterium]
MKSKSYELIREQVYSDRLDNGLPVYVIKKPGYYKSYAFFATNYGGADRRFKFGGEWIDTPEGVAHFLEHKMFDTEDGNALEELSANGAQPNAYTSTDVTGYYFESTDKFCENLEILLSFVSVPYFTKESVEKEQGIIGQEIRMTEDEPGYTLYYDFLKLLFRHNPARHSVAGTVESIAEITDETLYACHKIFYNPSNMALIVAGDVDPEKIVEIAKKILPTERGEIPQRDYGEAETSEPVAARGEKAMEVSEPMFVFGASAPCPVKGAERLKFGLTATLAAQIIGGKSSPLFFKLYDEGLVKNDFSAEFEATAGISFTAFDGQSKEPEKVFASVTDEIRRIVTEGLDDALFARIKKALFGRQLRMLNSEDAWDGFVRAHLQGYDTFLTAETLLTITVEDVLAFIREHMKPENFAMMTVTPKNAVNA